MKEKQEKPKKINRVRFGGGGPYVEKHTDEYITNLQETKEISKGRVLDMLVNFHKEKTSKE